MGDLVLEELPAVLGPRQLSPVCCLGCCLPLRYADITWWAACWQLCERCIFSSSVKLNLYVHCSGAQSAACPSAVSPALGEKTSTSRKLWPVLDTATRNWNWTRTLDRQKASNHPCHIRVCFVFSPRWLFPTHIFFTQFFLTQIFFSQFFFYLKFGNFDASTTPLWYIVLIIR